MKKASIRGAVLMIVLLAAIAGMATAQKVELLPMSDKAVLLAIDEGSKKAEALFKDKKTQEIFSLIHQMKDIGLAYDEFIVTPCNSRILQNKSMNQLAALWGMYSIDMTYALLFGKSIEKTLTFAVQLEERMDFDRATVAEASLVANREEKITKSLAFNIALARKAKDDPKFLSVLVNGFYGSTVELFHLFAKLGLSTGITREYVRFVNDNFLALELTQDILKAYSGDPRLVRYLDTAGNGAVISSLMNVLQASKTSLTENDLRKILAITDVARAPFVAFAP